MDLNALAQWIEVIGGVLAIIYISCSRIHKFFKSENGKDFLNLIGSALTQDVTAEIKDLKKSFKLSEDRLYKAELDIKNLKCDTNQIKDSIQDINKELWRDGR